jgi:hypothetical protein
VGDKEEESRGKGEVEGGEARGWGVGTLWRAWKKTLPIALLVCIWVSGKGGGGGGKGEREGRLCVCVRGLGDDKGMSEKRKGKEDILEGS